jgi:hypothetical protein
MVSFYHYEMGRKTLRYNGSFSEFIRHEDFGLDTWFRHYLSWKKYATSVVTYEDLQSSAFEHLSGLLDSLGLRIDPGIVKKAAERSRFDNVRKLEEKYGRFDDVRKDPMRSDFRFVRSGKGGVWRELFSEDDLAYYAALKRKHGVDLY